MLKCLACDRETIELHSSGFCVACTIENFKANGIPLSIREAITFGGEMPKHPELIVKLVRK